MGTKNMEIFTIISINMVAAWWVGKPVSTIKANTNTINHCIMNAE